MSLLLPTNLLQCRSSSLLLLSPSSSTTAFSAIAPCRICLRLVTSCVAYDQSSVVNSSAPKAVVVERDQIRLGLVSKGRMATNSLNLLKDCQLFVKQVNPRQYVAQIPQLPNTKVCFQRPKDIVTKLLSGDLDLGIVGLDKLREYGQIPNYGIFENIKSLKELAQMPQWSEERPLRVATGFTYLGPKFMKENGIKHVTFSTASGALEAAPAMGIADVVLDLVSSGTTLKENNLKEIEGGVVLQCKAVLVASRRALTKRKEALNTVQEILERLEAHLKADSQFTVVANFRGSSAEEVAERVLSQPSLSGWQGPTISPVYCRRGGKISIDYYAIVICVPKKTLYDSVKHLRAVGGSGVLVSPLTYIFDEDTPRWGQFLRNLGI
ncbi:ATP phosphoribosyltransferase 1, chloroplastic isoform X2 [Arabidopsis lyrata subsp. lyrata]|uniref:ATP phosphoribosyltransferase 1, chloroplastic isoform X2 n=1 Tax=Arabidopsis lyrata subsp. lyrata TaxID=81972 RepID=UPI000A29CAAE|nr:ATP phosphoribosyltransferase 1, chloroplastic isoform X2 [Arabidopsis lyrata subsp. lyrata]|eukprot:XP_020889920.1 ATP phosphoribosyltransferase 1, chloroplastic isoform X2 [Arabidopsis lyrata subsp. lyrata]